MSPKFRALIAFALVLVGWGIGYSMGGGFSAGNDSSSKNASSNRDSTISGDEARQRVGRVMESVPDAADEKRRHVPWDRERFKRAAAAFSKEGSLLSFARRAMQMTGELAAEDFPMVMEAHAELKDQPANELVQALEFFLVGRWAELDPKAAAEFLSANNKIGGLIDLNGAVFWNVWAGKDPAAAAAFTKTMGDASNRKQALKTIVETVAHADVDSALAFARIHAPELIADGTLSSVFGENKKITDPERAARRLESLGTFDHATVRSMKTAASEWAKRDRPAAREWAVSLPDAEARSNTLMGIYEDWFKTDRKAAAAALLAEPRTGVDLAAVASHFANDWDPKDWQGAAEWIKKLPAEKDQTGAAAELAGRLGRNDVVAGAEFLKALPEGAARDAAINDYIFAATDSEPEARMEWALSVSDAERRKKTTKNLLIQWFRKDSAAAFEWLESGSGMTPEERTAFLRGSARD